jgi:hypothetical protein
VRLHERQLPGLVVDGVHLGDRDDAVLDPQQPDDREMLVRLRARSLRGVHDEEEEIDPRRSRHHVAHEALVPGDVDEREAASAGQLERRIAQVDRDPALALLGQPVGVLAG